MIEVSNLRKVYQSRNGSVEAIAGISFSVADGEFVSIIGPSGCGKTTLIKIIGDLTEPSAGHVSVDGITPREARLRRMFSFVFQNPVLLPWRTVLENVRLPLEIVRNGARDPMDLLETVGLKGFESKYPDELSGGMQQRAALGRALTFDPKVLLMDEPFGKVDEFTRNELNQELLRIWKATGVTILLVTHSIAEAVYLADRVLVLTQRPARIGRTVQVPFPRPREPGIKETPEFQEIVKCLRLELQ